MVLSPAMVAPSGPLVRTVGQGFNTCRPRTGLALLLAGAIFSLQADPAFLSVWPCADLPVGASAGRQVVLDAPAQSVFSLQLRLAYTPAESTLAEIRAGALAQGMMLAVNSTLPGVLQVGLAGSSPVGGLGGLLEVLFTHPSDVELRIESASANEGALSTVLLPVVTLLSPPAGAGVTFPALFQWAVDGPATELRVAFATSGTPGPVVVAGAPSGNSYSLTAAEWSTLQASLGPASTYFWTVGQPGSFHPATPWRPFIPLAPPPTAARVLGFDARRDATRGVTLVWQTAVEFDLLGFRLERRLDETAWQIVPAGIIPARGGSRPNWYRYGDAPPAGEARGQYRLLILDFRGREHVAMTTEVRAALQIQATRTEQGLRLRFQGDGGTPVILETTPDPIRALWVPVGRFELDETGAQSAPLPQGWHEGPTRFFRVRPE